MTGQTPSQKKNLRKKLQKREQRVLERLKEAQQAQAKALEQYHRSEERLQKHMAQVQLIEGRLTLVRQQIDDLKVHPDMPPIEIEIPAWAQYIPPSTAAQVLYSNPGESINFASEGRAAAEAAEENTRLATVRAAEIYKTNGVSMETAEVAEIEAEEEIIQAHDNMSGTTPKIPHAQTQEIE